MSKRKFHRVAVLMGGPSAEREVSLKSGAAAAKGLRDSGYDVTEIVINDTNPVIPPHVEAVFIALHGAFGEDGTLQNKLEQMRLPYTGPGPQASLASFDKIMTKEILTKAKLPTPPYEVIYHPVQKASLPFPVVTKPVKQGSTIGVRRCFKEEEWEEAVNEALRYDKCVLAEKFIPGTELTIGIVVDEVLPIVEIRPQSGFYDYAAKYTRGLTEYIVPATLSAAKTQECQSLALAVYHALGCRGISRIDMIMTLDGNFYILENNTIPGLTETSLVPQAARAAGISFPELCDSIMNTARI